MDTKDYYKLLGVEKDASADTIKKAFRKMARKYHPDINKESGSEAMFKAVNQAYDVLKDPETRAEYDQIGKAPPRGQGFGDQGFGAYGQGRAQPDWDSGFAFSGGGPSGDEGFGDFFEAILRRGGGGGTGAGARAAHGADSHGRIEITIEDAFKGATRTLSMRAPVVAPDGSVSYQNRSISVHVPKGILEGQHIRLTGQGSPGFNGGPSGDLFLEVAFAAHPVYRAEGRDLYMDLPITPWEAALGGKVVMPTPAGKVDLSIPRNARTGQKLRLKGKGLPGPPAGNIYATLKIVNPNVETAQERALFEKMAKEMPFDPRAKLGG